MITLDPACPWYRFSICKGATLEAKGISVLLGRQFNNVTTDAVQYHAEDRDITALVIFETSGDDVALCHERLCCEEVYLAEVHGDIMDLVGAPILKASHETGETDVGVYHFYHLATMKGYVTFRFIAESNQYSHDVDVYTIHN